MDPADVQVRTIPDRLTRRETHKCCTRTTGKLSRKATSTNPLVGDATPVAAGPQEVTPGESCSSVGRRTPRIRRRPRRYRDTNSRRIQTGPSVYAESETERPSIIVSNYRSTLSNAIIDPVATSSTSLKVKKTRKRSNKEKEKRRNREKGPHPCPLCDHEPFKSISELRAHVIGVHKKHCSWTKQIRDVTPADVTEVPQPAHDINVCMYVCNMPIY